MLQHDFGMQLEKLTKTVSKTIKNKNRIKTKNKMKK